MRGSVHPDKNYKQGLLMPAWSTGVGLTGSSRKEGEKVLCPDTSLRGEMTDLFYPLEH